jgi:hypothetical protein
MMDELERIWKEMAMEFFRAVPSCSWRWWRDMQFFNMTVLLHIVGRWYIMPAVLGSLVSGLDK